jgi:integrating conjugative element protein (TIGR03757 family)
MTGNTRSIRFASWVSLVLVILTGNVVHAARIEAVTPQVIEVFTSSDLSITGGAVISPASGRPTADLQIYNLDGIQRVEAKLSEGLTSDPEQSKRIVPQRFQQLQEEDRAQMQRAAMGLAKALQYGIDRYPAIVFEGEVAIYGVTDIDEALHRYQQWQAGRKQ